MAGAQRALPNGVGLGLRWDFLEEVLEGPPLEVAFFEVSPENYMRRGGYYPAALERIGRRYPLVTHGLTLSIGAPDAPDSEYVAELGDELARLGSPWHSDHLAFTSSAGRSFHELLPLGFSRDAAARIADRLEALAATLARPVALENITYYAHPGKPELAEGDFLHTLFERTRAGLLLDVNNVYVNARNHGFDARAMLETFPLERTVEIHVAGHTRTPSGLILDTHGAPVEPEVLELLAWTLERTGPKPVLLERDNDVPELAVLLAEVRAIAAVVERATANWQERRTDPSRRPPQDLPGRGPATPSPQRGVAARATGAPEAILPELVLGPPLRAGAFDSLLSRSALSADDSAALRGDFERWLVYRKLVHGTLRTAVELAIPRTIARLGPLFDEYFGRFLSERGPRTHYLRDVTMELLDFCAGLWAKDTRVPPWALDLARHEALQIVVSSLREPLQPHELGELDLSRGLCFVEAARVARYAFAVHRLSEDEADRTPPEPTPTALFVYRDPEHDVRYLELTPLAATLIQRLLTGETLKDALLGACSATDTDPQRALEGTARLLADLADRGALLGAPARGADESLLAARESSIMARSEREKEPHERS